MSGNGWIKQMRNEKVLELMKLPNVFVLVTQIAQRAWRFNGVNAHGLSVGEAMLGDCENIGLTRQEYRTALKKTEKLGIATFRATNEGTIGKLVDTSIYDINAIVEQPPEKPTRNRPTTIEQPLIRMKERKKERKEAPPSPLPPQTAAPAAQIGKACQGIAWEITKGIGKPVPRIGLTPAEREQRKQHCLRQLQIQPVKAAV
jgi:hypothetical protein